METKKIVNWIAKNKFTKWTQAIEISCFIIGGYLLYNSPFEAGVIVLVGIFAAIFASQSAIVEHELKKEAEGNGSS